MISGEAAIERPPSAVRHAVDRVRHGRWLADEDIVAAEEPMEVRLAWDEDGIARRMSVAVTMRTPGDDFELAAGFLFSEQILRSRDDIADIAYCVDDDVQAYNVVTVTLRPGLAFDRSRLERNFFTSSSCGICGKATIESIEVAGCEPLAGDFHVPAALFLALPQRLREAQDLFEATGGLHAAGLFRPDGSLEEVKEDVGRHNALDKLIGARVLAGEVPLDSRILCLSGRAGYELLQKALVARIPVVAAVGAPSSLAVELARAFNITLLGFVKERGFNVYSGRERLVG